MLVPRRFRSAVPALRGVRPSYRGLQSDIDRLFADAWRGFGFAPAADTAGRAGAWIPQVDISETDDEFRLVADLPGLEEKDFELHVEGDVLTLKGERRDDRKDEAEGYYHVESVRGSFERSFQLPFEVDPETVKASYKNGVLTVTLPKPAEARPPEARSIPIQSD